jgi:hypothetical protein
MSSTNILHRTTSSHCHHCRSSLLFLGFVFHIKLHHRIAIAAHRCMEVTNCCLPQTQIDVVHKHFAPNYIITLPSLSIVATFPWFCISHQTTSSHCHRCSSLHGSHKLLSSANFQIAVFHKQFFTNCKSQSYAN